MFCCASERQGQPSIRHACANHSTAESPDCIKVHKCERLVILANQRCMLLRARYVRQVSSTNKGTEERYWGDDSSPFVSILPIFAHCLQRRGAPGAVRRAPTRPDKARKARQGSANAWKAHSKVVWWLFGGIDAAFTIVDTLLQAVFEGISSSFCLRLFAFSFSPPLATHVAEQMSLGEGR